MSESGPAEIPKKEGKKGKTTRNADELVEFNQDWLHTLRERRNRGKISEIEERFAIARAMASLQLRLDRESIRAITDPLTRLRNRGAFNSYYESLSRQQQPFGVLLLDIDHFKKVNDTYGHPAGDSVLFQVGMSIQNTTRQVGQEEEDMVARYGGEEIAVLLPNIREATHLKMIAEKIRESIASQPFSVGNNEIPVTVSIGGGVFKGGNKDKFFQTVDDAVYQAKDTGRNKSVIHGTQLRVV